MKKPSVLKVRKILYVINARTRQSMLRRLGKIEGQGDVVVCSTENLRDAASLTGAAAHSVRTTLDTFDLNRIIADEAIQ